MNLPIAKKTDRRMSGHQFFQYRVRSTTALFNDGTERGRLSAHRQRIHYYCEFVRFFTQRFGVGVTLDYVYVYTADFEATAHWSHRGRWGSEDDFYLRGAEELEAFEEFSTWYALRYA